MKCLTVRNLPLEVSAALDAERKRRGTSLNSTVIDLLRCSLIPPEPGPPSNGLGKYAGGWSQEEFEEFEAAVSGFEMVDESLWG